MHFKCAQPFCYRSILHSVNYNSVVTDLQLVSFGSVIQLYYSVTSTDCVYKPYFGHWMKSEDSFLTIQYSKQLEQHRVWKWNQTHRIHSSWE